MQTIIDGILTNYEIFGDKNKNTLLILHGWKNSFKNWEEIGEKLSAGNKIVLLDLPGMGGSSMPTKTFDSYDYAEFVNKFIQKLKLTNLSLMGHSFGGKIGLIAAEKNSKISKLILVDISGIENRSLMTSLRINLSKVFKIFLPKKFSNSFGSSDYKNAGDLLEIFKKIVREDIAKDAKKIKIPSLIIWGEDDKEVPLSSAKKLKELISNSSLRIVWKAGHHPHLEKPEKFLEIIYEYL